MPAIRRYTALSALLLLVAALILGPAALQAAPAEAASLEGLTVPSVGEVAGQPVENVEKVTESVQEVTEAVTAPVQETVETTAPPAAKVVETVAPPVQEAAGTVGKATENATKAVPSPPTATPKVPAAPSVDPPVAKVTHAVSGAPAAVTKSVRSPAAGNRAAPSSSVDAEPATSTAASTEALPPADPNAGSTGGARSRKRGTDKFRAPTKDGSVRAPVPKWIAYVWPAIALAWPGSETASDQPGGQPGVGHGSGPTEVAQSGSQEVAGVHASHGSLGNAVPSSHSSSSSPFSKIPDAVGSFTAQVPGEFWAYLIIAAILVAAVFAAVKYELARRGSGG